MNLPAYAARRVDIACYVRPRQTPHFSLGNPQKRVSGGEDRVNPPNMAASYHYRYTISFCVAANNRRRPTQYRTYQQYILKQSSILTAGEASTISTCVACYSQQELPTAPQKRYREQLNAHPDKRSRCTPQITSAGQAQGTYVMPAHVHNASILDVH